MVLHSDRKKEVVEDDVLLPVCFVEKKRGDTSSSLPKNGERWKGWLG